MGTFTTGIPLITRNIQPPLFPVTRISVSKVITDELSDTQTFHINIVGDNGYSASNVPITQQQPLVFNKLQYGTYTVSEATAFGYTLTSITPSTFVISADNPQQTVEIINSKDTVFATIKYGLLYNWYAASDARKITSSDDWVVPTQDQNQILADYLGASGDYSTNTVGGKLKETGLTHWNSPNTGATNETVFNGRGSGWRLDNGAFSGIKDKLQSWSSTLWFGTVAYFTTLSNLDDIFVCKEFSAIEVVQGLGIRLLYIGAGTPTSYTGNDGKVYPVVLIGTQYWIAANLSETKYRNGDWITGYDGGVYTPISNAAWAALTTEAMCAYDDDINNI